MKIVLTNAHSSANIGDGGIVKACTMVIRRAFPDADITLLTRYVKDASRSYEGLVDRVLPPVPALVTPGEEPNWKRAARFAGSAMLTSGAVTLGRLRPNGGVGAGGDGQAALEALARADLVMPVGGGYLYSSRSRVNLTLAQHLYLIGVAEWLGRRIVTFPMSLGPLRKRADRAAARYILRHIESLALREQFSLEEAITLGIDPRSVALVPDVAFTFAQPETERPRSNRVAVTLLDWTWASGSSYPKPLFQRYYDVLLQTCCHLQRRFGLEVVLLPHADVKNEIKQTDLMLTERFKKELSNDSPVTIVRAGSEQEVMATFANCDLVLGTRLHSCIFALCAGTPCINLSYQPKGIGTFMLVGLADCAFDVESLERNRLIARAEEMIADHDSMRWRVSRAALGASAAVHDHYGRLFAKC